MNVSCDFDRGNRSRVLEQLGLKPVVDAAIVGLVRGVLPGTQVGLLVGSRPWLLFVARMNQIRDQGGPALINAHLARLQDNKEASGAAAVGRLVAATLTSLTTRPACRPSPRPGVSAAAARSPPRWWLPWVGWCRECWVVPARRSWLVVSAWGQGRGR
ncbi:hypothetical protein ABZ891_31120 [Streptomyces sp. NPDC047023]|uniref:hypothetical protein n=1 Tax=Streptomyces sp. NPDC047023 TaxID=3155139 RepID=UPI0033C7E2E7